MKAMILAAGTGSRLRPLTDTIPKALLPIGNIPILEIIIKKLSESGFNEIIINVHHHADMVMNFIQSYYNHKVKLAISDERMALLDSGGGIVNAANFFNPDESFLVHNVDILSDIDLNDLYQYHLNTKAMATLAVKTRKTSRYLLIDDNNCVRGWKNSNTGETKPSGINLQSLHECAFSGIHVIHPDLFKQLPSAGSFSMIDEYIRLSKEVKINAYHHNDTDWIDIGKPDQYALAQNYLTKH